MVAILHIPAQPIDPYRLGRDPLPFKDLTRIGYRMSKEAKIKYRLAVEQDVPTILWLIKVLVATLYIKQASNTKPHPQRNGMLVLCYTVYSNYILVLVRAVATF